LLFPIFIFTIIITPIFRNIVIISFQRMADTEQSIWYVVLPIMLTGIFSAVSWVVRGKYEHTKHLRSQYAFMKTELKLTSMKDKLEEFYWPIYLRLVRHLNYVKRFHKLSDGELKSEITPIEEHIDDSEFLPFAGTPTPLTGLSDNSPLDLHVDVNNIDQTTIVLDTTDEHTNERIENTSPIDGDNESDNNENNEIVINMTENEQGETCKLDLCVDDLIDEVKEMNDDTTTTHEQKHLPTESAVVDNMRIAMRQRSKSKTSDLFDTMKKRMNQLMHLKKSYNKQMLDNLLEVKYIFERKTAISSPDQALGSNLLQLDSYVTLYKSVYESGDYHRLPCKATHGIDFPFDIIRILAKKLSEYQNMYDKLVDELDVFEDDEKRKNK